MHASALRLVLLLIGWKSGANLLSQSRSVVIAKPITFRHSNENRSICRVVAYGRLQTQENFKLLVLKVVAVAYERWSLTRDSKYSDLTWELLVFWKTGRWGKVVVTRGGCNRRFDCIKFHTWKLRGDLDQWLVIQDLTGSWCIKGTYNRCPAWIHRFLWCTMIQLDLGSLILIQITPKERTLVFYMHHTRKTRVSLCPNMATESRKSHIWNVWMLFCEDHNDVTPFPSSK